MYCEPHLSSLLGEPAAPRRSFELGVEKTHRLASFSLVFEEPLSWSAFEQAMAVLPAPRGPDLLRVKGPSRSRSAVGRSSSILSSMSPTLCSSFETGGTGTGDRDWSSSPEAARREPVAGSLPWSPRWPNPPAHNRPCSEPSPRLYRLSLHRVVSAPSQTGAGVPVKQNARLRWRSHRYPYPGSLAETHERGR